MSLAMAFTVMPITGAPVYADDPASAAICLANGAAPNIKGGQIDNIYFGHYPQSEADSVEGRTEDVDYIKVGDKNYLIEPIKWRALYFPIDSQGNLLPELVLLSDQNLDCKQYHEQNTSITWKDSTIRAWLNDGFKKTAFLSSEQEAVNLIEVVNKANPESLTPGGDNTEDQLFLLSIEEATNEKYGFTDNYGSITTREAKNTAYAKAQGASTNSAGNGFWWLRSPGHNDRSAALVADVGDVSSDGVGVDGYGVRPAFNLNLSSVLFTSAAEGGKSSGDVGAGSLKEVGTNETNEWKLTVKDKAHGEFKVEKVTTCDGKTLNIKYSDAKKEDGEYISAIITNRSSKIKYYGNLKQFVDRDSTPDTAEVTIDGKLESTDKLYIINEQLNGDKKTDFSSPLQKVEIPTAYHDLTKTDKVEPTCTTPGTEEYWTCENCTEMFSDKDGKTKIAEPEEISATGHKYGEWIKLNATQHQKVCQHDKSHVVKENHKWDGGKVTKNATEKQAGTKTFTCTVCKATKTETIPKLEPSTPKVSGTPLAEATVKNKSMTIGWNKIQGAEVYDVFFAHCNHGKKEIKCRKVKTVKGNRTFKWTKSGLKKGTAYKFYVRAYVTKNGRKTYVSKSPTFHAYTGNGTGEYTSAKSVKVNKTKVTLKKGKTFRIKARVNKVNKKKKLMPESHAPTLRYMSSDSKVAKVNSSGRITAKGTGKCTIYVFAHNGVSKSIKVTVP